MISNKMALVVLLLGLPLAVGIDSAFSQMGPESYLRLKGGYYSPTGSFQGESFDGTPYWELAGGLNWGLVGTELGVGYFKTENNLVDIETVPIQLSGKLRLPILFVVPYARGGIGAYYSRLSYKSGEASGGKWSGGVHGGLGVDFRLGPVLLGVEGTYLAVQQSFNTGDVTMDGVTVTGSLGFRF